jgi:hypothetical protein
MRAGWRQASVAGGWRTGLLRACPWLAGSERLAGTPSGLSRRPGLLMF